MELARNEVALITGASSGIGYDFANICAREGFDLLLVARNTAKLNEMRHEIERGRGVNVYALPADLGRPGAAEHIYDQVRKLGLHIDILANIAGFANFGTFATLDEKRIYDMVQVNMAAPTMLCRMCIPAMIERGHGHVLNVASVAAFGSGPLMAEYYATKAYVLSLSQALSIETEGTGVSITALCPGPTNTKFEQNGNLNGSHLFKRLKTASSNSVAEFGYAEMMKGTQIAIPGRSNKFLAHVSRLLTRKRYAKFARDIQK